MYERRKKPYQTKLLSGSDLAAYVKERQAYMVRQIIGAGKRSPKLIIFYDNNNPVIHKYIDLKKTYGGDIGVVVEDIVLKPESAIKQLRDASEDQNIDAIIVQLPLKIVPSDILQHIAPTKDVDGLNGGFDSATAEAINWLVGGHNIDLKTKKIAIVGRGRLVGAPLIQMWQNSGFNPAIFDHGDDLSLLKNYNFIVTATGSPALIKSDFVTSGTILIDAGTTSEDGAIKGDADPALYARADISITPKIGGVGPLTVASLFDHVLRASK